MTLAPRAVVVHRATEREELVARHGTRQQVAFFLASRGRSLDDVEARHAVQHEALDAVAQAIPLDWRRGDIERADLSRFVFGPEDVVVAVGQDGLVANVAKYLHGQVVIGVNPDPERNPGVLVPHRPEVVAALLSTATGRDVGSHVQARVMVEATVDDGQRLRALNEVFVGHPSHQSARYRITTAGGRSERHSSSGVLVGTGTGATGWCRSVWLERQSGLVLPQPEELRLAWFVREAWPSPASGTDCTEGEVAPGEELAIVAESDLVIFGDGIESDALSLTWGQRVALTFSDERLHLVV